MENAAVGSPEKRVSNGPSVRRSPTTRPLSGEGAPSHLNPPYNLITIYRDERGYGMKVSGDNPVYVQSVKEGGAAQRAGLHSGDTIIKVNGVNVTNRTHTEVVDLIKAAPQVELLVNQGHLRERSASTVLPSPNLHANRHLHHSLSTGTRITAPQPADNEKLRQFEDQKANTLKLMLEKEQRFVDSLRSKLAKCSDPSVETKLQRDLAGAERRVHTLQQQLEQEGLDCPPPPPLPSRNLPSQGPSSPSATSPPPLPPRHYLFYPPLSSLNPMDTEGPHATSPMQLNAPMAPCASPTNLLGGPGPQVHTHHRTKSSPDSLGHSFSSAAEASRILIASESMSDLDFGDGKGGRRVGGGEWEDESPQVMTPPGTPPPPYLPSNPPPPPPQHHHHLHHHHHILDDHYTEIDELNESPDPPHNEGLPGELQEGHGTFGGFAPGQTQQPIISMEDEDMSDQEINHIENHGPFRSLSKLWSHQAHLAVFLNYVLSNSDPASLLFYLVTDLYKEGNAKEMKKWAYEIHSSFLVPGAPLRLSNVDENVAREIDDVLLKESDKEEILRKIFWKARQKAKEELNEQLTDFQAKRTAGLGTLFGPKDSELEESINDKSKEMKIIEAILVPKMEPFLDDIDHGHIDDRRFTMGAALGTVIAKVFGIRGQHFNALLERCPTYVSKDKSLKAKLIGRSRKVSVRGHTCIAHQYYTVTYCNHCQLIIWGIGPQGYQCTNCGLNIHRNCVSVVEENCPGPMPKKDKDRISKLMDRIRSENPKKKPSFVHLDKGKKFPEEDVGPFQESESGERCGSGGSSRGGGGVAGGGGDKRPPDPLREAEERLPRPLTSHDPDDSTSSHHDTFPHSSHHLHHHHHHHHHPSATKSKPTTSTINRSESYKERITRKKQRERRKTSDPNLSKTNTDVELDPPPPLSYKSNSGSSSNSSLSTRSLESPSNSLEAVSGGGSSQQQPWDSDMEAEADPPDWTTSVPEEVHKNLSEEEKKRQEIINELFYTEKSHVRGLKVLDQVFYRPMKDQQIIPPDQIQLLFPNLDEILGFHSRFNNAMKVKRKENHVVGEIGDILLEMFDGSEGEGFQRAATTFCSHQQIALEALKEARKRNLKLHSFLRDAEMNPICRRLQLKDIITIGWLRLTKYPLLFENLAKHSVKEGEEAVRLKRAIERSKEILNHVDKAVKETEDHYRLAEIQRRLDRTQFDKSEHSIAVEFKNLDLTKHKLIFEGPLNWKIASRPKPIDLHVLLLEDIIILLQKQDDKFVLKFYSNSLSPIIKMSNALVRPNAVDKRGLYLVNTSLAEAQIYDLVAHSANDKKKWFKYISDAAEAYKQREGKHRRPDPTVPTSSDCDTSSDKIKEEDVGVGEGSPGANSEVVTPPTSTETPNGTPTPPSGELPPQPSPQPSTPAASADQLGDGGGGLRKGEDQLHASPAISRSLIDPTEVLVSQRDVLTAEPVLTPLEKLRRKGELVREVLLEKQTLVADILHVPREDFETIVELAGEPSIDKDPSELVLAAVNQVNQLYSILNEALQVTEEEAVAATSEVSGSQPKVNRLPGVPAYKLQKIASNLSSHLTQLLSLMAERDEEREKLRREVQRSREQIHALHERQVDHNGPTPRITPEEMAVVLFSDTPASAPEVFVDAIPGGREEGTSQ